MSQKETPTKGDFIQLIEKDLKALNITYEETITNRISKLKLKTIAKSVAFKVLLETQSTHKKVKHINYPTLNIQPYLTSDLVSQDNAKTLTALRSQCVKGVRHNFTKMYKKSLKCPLQCNLETPQEDTQEHILICGKLSQGKQMNLNDIFASNVQLQAKLAKIISPLLRRRKQLLEDQEDPSCVPGASLPGPGLSAVVGGCNYAV